MDLITGILLGLLLKDLTLKSVEAQTFELPKTMNTLEGSCVVIPCKFTYAKLKPVIKGLQYTKSKWGEIYNSKNSSSVLKSFLGRVSLVGDLTKGNCTIRINNVSSQDDGLYFPQIDFDPPTLEAKSEDKVYLYINNPPKMVSIQNTHETGRVRKGDKLELICQGYGNPDITNYTWYKNNQTVPFGHTIKVLHMDGMTEDKSGQYYCLAGNDIGETKSEPVTLICVDCVSSRIKAVVAAVVTVVLLIILAVVTVIWYRRKRASRPPSPATEEASRCTNVYMNVMVPHDPKPVVESPYAALQTDNRCPDYEQLQPQNTQATNKPPFHTSPSYSVYEEVVPFRSQQNKK